MTEVVNCPLCAKRVVLARGVYGRHWGRGHEWCGASGLRPEQAVGFVDPQAELREQWSSRLQ